MNSPTSKKFISTKNASELSGYNQDHLSRLARSGEIDAVRVGRTWHIERGSLENFLREHGRRVKEFAGFISAKDASKKYGYSPDYLARLARSGEINGSQMGRTWLVDRESLETFLKTQEERKEARARELARAREIEYRIRQAPERRATSVISQKPVTPTTSQFILPRKSPVRAFVIALFVVALGATVAQAGSITGFASETASVARNIATGFDASFGDIPTHFIARVNTAEVNMHLENARGAVLLARTTLPLSITTLTHPALKAPKIALVVKSFIPYAISPALVADGMSAVREWRFAAADTLTFLSSPSLMMRVVADVSNTLIRADVSLAYGLASAGPASARTTVSLLVGTGDLLARTTARVPSLATSLFFTTTAAPSNIAPALAQTVFDGEYTAAAHLLALTNRIGETYLALVYGAGSTVSANALALRHAVHTALALSTTLNPSRAFATLANTPAALEDAYLGALGNTALALDSFGTTLAGTVHTPLIASAFSALSPGEQLALATYDTINGLFSSTTNALADLFAPPPTIVFPTERPVVALATTTPKQVVLPPSVTRILTPTYPTYTTVVQGVSQDFVNQSLATMKNGILATISGMIQPVIIQGATNQQSIQQVNMIQDLANLTVKDGTFQGGTFDSGNLTNGISVSATTGSFGTLFGGSVSLATTTITGAFAPNVGSNILLSTNAAGTLVGTSTPSVASIIATSTSATSTFAGSLAIDTNGFVYATSTRNVGIGVLSPAALLALENSTSTQPIFTASNAAGAEIYRITDAGFVGIGTTSPWAQLSVNPNDVTGPEFAIGSSTRTDLVVTNGGRLGLGTTTPDALLSLFQNANGLPFISAYRNTDIAPSGDFLNYKTLAGTTLFRVDNSGNLFAGGIINSGSQTITSTSTPQFRVQYDASNEITTSVNSAGATTFGVNGSAPSLAFTPQSNATSTFNFTNAADASVLSIDTLDGRVGIGTTTPLSALAVGGTGGLSVGADYNTAAPNNGAIIEGNVGIGTTSPLSNLSIQGTSGQSALNVASTTGASELYVAANGNVGIGTANPGYSLDVIGSMRASGNVVALNDFFAGNGTAAVPSFSFASGLNTGMYQPVASTLGFSTGGTEQMRITSAGNVGIGTTNPGSKLDVQGVDSSGGLANFQVTNAANDPVLKIQQLNSGGNVGNNQGLYINVVGVSTGRSLTVMNNTTTNLVVQNNGNVGIGTTSPSQTLSVTSPNATAVALTTTGYGNAFTTTNGSVSAAIYTGSAAITFGDAAGNNQAYIVPGSNYYTIYTNGSERMRINSSGNVGIGTASPAYKLDVAGFVNTDQYSGYKQAGINILYASSTNDTVLVGPAGSHLTSASNFSTAVGWQALTYATSSISNTAIGYQALENVANYTTNPGSSLYSGSFNTALGSLALSSNTSGVENTASGYQALSSNIGGNYNTASGGYVLYQNTTGSRNVAIGMDALFNNQSATSSTAIGMLAGYGNASYSNQGGVYLGYQSGYSAITGSDYNTLLGYNSGYGITSGAGNIVIGANVDAPSATASNQLNIGNLLYGTGIYSSSGSSPVVSSAPVNGSIGVASSSPWAQLSVNQNGITGPAFAIGSSTATNFVVTNGGNVGIGTTSPSQLLSVSSSGGNSAYFSGNVGIGTQPSANSLTVVGTGDTSSFHPLVINGTGTLYNNDLLINNTISGVNLQFTFGSSGSRFAFGTITNHPFGLFTNNSYDNLSVAPGGTVGIGGNITNDTTAAGANMVVLGTGNVGIGTTTPTSKLTVTGSGCFDLGPGSATVACGTAAGNIYYQTANTGAYDVAENYLASAALPAATLVGLDSSNPGFITTATSSVLLLGAVSTAPGMVLGGADGATVGQTVAPVALSGRVPVSVSGANGPIDIGDRLMLSSTTPGVAVKALHSGQTIGIALGAYSGSGTGKVDVFVSPQYWFAPSDFSIDPTTGSIGIGTTTPHNTLTVAGDIGAIAFVNTSTRSAKDDISYVDASTTEDMYNQLLQLKAATYLYKIEPQNDPLRLGFIAEDAQTIAPEILSPDGKGVDLYKLATFTLSGVQVLAGKVDALDTRLTSLEARVAMLESGAVSSASGSPITLGTTSLASAFSGLGVLIEKGIAQFNTLVFRQLVASTDSNGTSSAGSVTILAGNTVAQVNNALVLPTTKVFITFNAQVTGSWWVSDKAVGSFRVVLSAPQANAVSFDYFLVQTEGQIATSTPDGSFPSVSQSSGPDTIPPVITLLGDNPVHVSVGSTFTEPGVTVTDDVDGTDPYITFINGIQQVVSSTTIDTSSPTTYIITYKATDAAGNVATAIRSVIVGNPDGTVSVGAATTTTTTIAATATTTASSDTTPPVVTLNGSAAMELNLGDTFTDPGATALDSVDGTLTAKIVETGTVSTTTIGIYTLTYSVTDSAGNTGSASRVVSVVAPTVTSTASTTTTTTASTTTATSTTL